VVGEMKKLSALCKVSSPQSASALEGTAPEFVLAVKKVCQRPFGVANALAASWCQEKRFGNGHWQFAYGDQHRLPANHPARKGPSVVVLYASFASCPARVMYFFVTYHALVNCLPELGFVHGCTELYEERFCPARSASGGRGPQRAPVAGPACCFTAGLLPDWEDRFDTSRRDGISAPQKTQDGTGPRSAFTSCPARGFSISSTGFRYTRSRTLYASLSARGYVWAREKRPLPGSSRSSR
jgi:hypothetical protein